MGFLTIAKATFSTKGTPIFKKKEKQSSLELHIGVRKSVKSEKEVPIWERYTLTIEEASEYFRIGRTRLRQLIHENPDAEFLLMVGNRMQIKRKEFERYIDRATTI